MQWLSKWKPEIRGRSILELGCGVGDDTREIEKYARSVVCGDLEFQCSPSKGTQFVQMDHAKLLPFSCEFDVVIASLCLHYFRWGTTKNIISEISRVLGPRGIFICRLNSIEDGNYGATGYPELETGLFNVEGMPKRFFSENEIYALLSHGWSIESIEHKCIDRYKKPKWVWEFGASYA